MSILANHVHVGIINVILKLDFSFFFIKTNYRDLI